MYVGQTLDGRFQIESKIGEGGFGAVYRGIQLPAGRKVAIKLLHPEMTKDDNLVKRFIQEGQTLCKLRDPHTITTYEFDSVKSGSLAGTLYIAMELLEGKSLHQLFHEQTALDWKRMFKILIQMCSSLAEAHAQGVVHRDLKPENIHLENRSGNPEFVKILDFGIAKVMRGDSIDPQSPQLTATGQTLGTLEYMSPEQLMGKPLDGRSDGYALGVLAYEMITGRLPFPDAKGPAGLITAQLKQTPMPPSMANAKAAIPAAADRVILKCLEKDKNNRYSDVTQLASALQEVLSNASAEHATASRPPAVPPGAAPELLDTRRGVEPPAMAAPPGMPPGMQSINQGPVGPGYGMASVSRVPTPPHGAAEHHTPYPQVPHGMGSGPISHPYPMHDSYAQMAPPTSRQWVWWAIALLALGAVAGALLAFVV
jgi:eukaryotic-like serine/threonine-protein kinase